MRRRTERCPRPRRVWRAAATAAAGVALFAALWTAGAAAAAPGDVVWRDLARRAPGGDDAYTAVAVGPAGQVCAAGATASSPGEPSDVLVRAYGAGGSVLWRRVWTWPGRSDDGATAMARDRRGGYVVAGSSGSSWLLLKYTAHGYLQWVRRGKGSFARCALAAVTLDRSGNVYAAGFATPAGGDSRLFALKCSAAGVVRWQRTYGTDAGDAAAAAIATGGGDVYVAGEEATGPGTSAALLLRFSPDGARRWAYDYVAPDATSARATALTYASGPVVAGWSTSAGDVDDGFAARYTAGGTRQWVAGHTATGVTADRFRDVAVDSAGRVCVAGDAVTAGGSQALAACWDGAGTALWSYTASGTQGFAVCPVEGGFAFTGGTGSLTGASITAMGAPVWEHSISPAGYDDFRPVTIRASGSAYLYAAGSAAADGGGRASVLVRYRP
jgi:hypothetical protein